MLANLVQLSIPAMQREPAPDFPAFPDAAVPAIAALDPGIHCMDAEVLKASVARCHQEQIGIARSDITVRVRPI
jgi:hypothetical protein